MNGRPEKDKSLCANCRENYYNSATQGGCWAFKAAKVVKRYRIGWWTTPDTPGAFTRVWTLDCHREPGRTSYSATVPSFAVDVRDLTAPVPR